MSSQNEARLVEAALSGDKLSFSLLVDKHQQIVISLARQRTLNSSDAEDIAQETFLRAYRDLRKLRQPERFASWLYRIAINVAHEWNRKNRRVLPLEIDPASPASSENPEEEHRRARLLTLVAELPEKYRVPLTLHYVKNMKYEEIAELLGLNESTARSHVHRAKAMLRSKLQY